MRKRLLSFVLAALMIASLLPATALAADIVASGTCGAEGDGSNLTWTLDSEGVLTISGSGDMHDYIYNSPWHENGNQIRSVFMANGVTSIGNFAFYECISLTSMTIPDSVTCIGNCAFNDCSSLASVTIPDSVASIGVYAFCGCTSLKSVTIPDSVTSIGDYAFGFCTSLTGIWVDGGSSHYFSDASGVLFNKDKTVLAQCPGAFSGSYVIPDGVTSINDAAFVNCTSLTSVTIPDGVTNIGYEVFAGCTSLANMVLPNGVTRIGAEAFDWCTSMKSITIPDSVTSIGYDAFSNCKSLTNVYFTGTEEAWNGITIDDGNDALKNAKIHCNYVSHTHNYKNVVTAPTCMEKGYTTHTCSCGDSYVDTYIDALGHDWDEGKVTKQPTETETGVMTYTCTRCDATKTETIPATGSVDVTQMFTDVKKGWAYPGIQYCVTNGLIAGKGNGKFDPSGMTTRAEFVQMLYSLHGKPEVSGALPFTDLPEGWYRDAILWAYQTGVTSGTSDTTFGPYDPVTRAQVATFLMKYAKTVCNIKPTWTPADLSKYPDVNKVPGWALGAMQDAVALKLINGSKASDGTVYLDPNGNATREQVATILMQFCKNVKK